MFGDVNTSSSNTGTVAIRDFTMTYNKFDNISGSFACRGLASDPIRLAIVQHNVFNHTTAHSLFWDSVEISGGVKKILCTDNTGTIDAPLLKRGFLQAWSKSDLPWKIEYARNTLSGYKLGLKIAMAQPSFYAPDSADSFHKIVIKESELTNVAFGLSYLYKNVASGSSERWTDTTGTYNPGNISTFPNAPPVTLEGTVPVISF
jgi:hypothetical protein